MKREEEVKVKWGDRWRLRGVWVVRFRIFISSEQKEFVEEKGKREMVGV